jgi:hypothetical protein
MALPVLPIEELPPEILGAWEETQRQVAKKNIFLARNSLRRVLRYYTEQSHEVPSEIVEGYAKILGVEQKS